MEYRENYFTDLHRSMCDFAASHSVYNLFENILSDFTNPRLCTSLSDLQQHRLPAADTTRHSLTTQENFHHQAGTQATKAGVC